MRETNKTRAFTRFMSVAVIVLTATTLGVAGVPDGSLDLTFGVGGRVTTEDPTPFASAEASAIQPDGKIIAAGTVIQPNGFDFDFRLVRYNQDGSVDPTFGMQGSVTTSFSERGDVATALALQSDGKIIAAGVAYAGTASTSGDFALVRYNRDGSLDTDFGKGGKVITDLSGASDSASSSGCRRRCCRGRP